MSIVQTILDQRATAWEQAKAIVDTAEGESRTLSAEEQTQFDTINAEIDRLDTQRASIEAAEQRAKDAAEAMSRIVPPPAERKNVNDELRSFLNGTGKRFFDTHDADAGPVNFRDLTKGSATAGGGTRGESAVSVATLAAGDLVEKIGHSVRRTCRQPPAPWS